MRKIVPDAGALRVRMATDTMDKCVVPGTTEVLEDLDRRKHMPDCAETRPHRPAFGLRLSGPAAARII